MGFLSFTLIIFIYILIIYGSNRISTTKKNEVETKTCSYFLPSRESAIRPLCASAYPRRAPLQLAHLICAPKSAGLNANPLPSPTRPPPPPSIDRPRPLAASSASVRPRYRRLASLARLPHQRRNPSTVLHPHHTVSRNRRQGRRRSGTQLPPLVGRVADLGRARAPPLPRLPSHPSSTVDPSSVSPQSFAVPPSSAPSVATPFPAPPPPPPIRRPWCLRCPRHRRQNPPPVAVVVFSRAHPAAANRLRSNLGAAVDYST
jgi:hypothetical protein